MHKKTIIIYLILFLTILIAQGQDSDSSQVAHELKELIVKSNRVKFIDNTIVFSPNKDEKKLSNSPQSLLEAMHLPMIKINGNEVSSLSGQAVSLFINGVEISDTDLATFYPSDVISIEYIPNPTDPIYGDSKIAINFVVKRFEVGGISRADAFQRFPNNGIYQIASRLEHKEMTYAIMASFSYRRDHINSEDGIEQYNNLFFDNQYYDIIERDLNQQNFERSNNVKLVINTKYQSSTALVSHWFSFTGNQDLGSGFGAINRWNPQLFNSEYSHGSSRSKSRSPQVRAKYFWRLGSKWMINIHWNYAHSHNEQSCSNTFNSISSILTNFHENVNSAKLSFIPVFMVKQNMQVRLYLNWAGDWFDAKYKGTTNAISKQEQHSANAKPMLLWMPRNNLNFSIAPGIVYDSRKLGPNIKYNHTRPMIEGASSLSFRKFLISGNVLWYTQSPESSATNNIIIQNTDLLWVKGNPNLKNLTSWGTNIGFSCLTSVIIQPAFSIHYERTNNSFATIYTPADIYRGGLIKYDINSPKEDYFSSTLSFSFKPLHNLSFKINPSWSFQKTSGAYSRSLNCLGIYGNIDYQLGNFSFSMAYEPHQKSLYDGGMKIWHQTDKLNAGIRYGNGNVYVSCKVENIVHKFEKCHIIINSPNYYQNNTHSVNGRCFTINLTYTIGYGKKIDDSSIENSADLKSSYLNR